MFSWDDFYRVYTNAKIVVQRYTQPTNSCLLSLSEPWSISDFLSNNLWSWNMSSCLSDGMSEKSFIKILECSVERISSTEVLFLLWDEAYGRLSLAVIDDAATLPDVLTGECGAVILWQKLYENAKRSTGQEIRERRRGTKIKEKIIQWRIYSAWLHWPNHSDAC
jgi:hypothetical protein